MPSVGSWWPALASKSHVPAVVGIAPTRWERALMDLVLCHMWFWEQMGARLSRGCESHPHGDRRHPPAQASVGWEETNSTHPPSHMEKNIPPHPKPVASHCLWRQVLGQGPPCSAPAHVELWVKAKPSGLVTISKMSVLPRMAVTEGYWPYSSAIAREGTGTCLGAPQRLGMRPSGTEGRH